MATADQIPSDLTLEIETNLSPEAFLAASRNFFGLIEEIAASVDSNDKMEWAVRVREGSNLLAMEPASEIVPEKLKAILDKARVATQRLTVGDVENAGLGEKALSFIRGLSQVTQRGKRNTFIRLWVERDPLPITNAIAAHIQEYWRSDYHDYGTIDGKLEAIQDSGGLQLRVRDSLFQNLVTCVLRDDMLANAFSNFRRRVEVSGVIHYRTNGSPISIVADAIAPLPDDSELPSHNDVRGILAA
jgi:hypothetical protein